MQVKAYLSWLLREDEDPAGMGRTKEQGRMEMEWTMFLVLEKQFQVL